MLRVVLATANPHKVSELRAVLGVPGVEFLTLGDVTRPPGGFVEPSETGSTFEQNAEIKALSYAAQTGLPCLADDSGIEIDALALPDGTPRPGVISSHYCTDGCETGMTRAERDAANNARVLRELRGVPPERRPARFVCVMALAAPGVGANILALTRGTFEGRIGLPADELPPEHRHRAVPRGDNGFGYDPLFLVAPDFRLTSAELAPQDKNRLSHRAAAAARMTAELRRLRTPPG